MSHECPLPVIGFVRTARTTPEATPVQTALNQEERGALELAEAYADGLTGLDGFDYAWLLTWLDRPDAPLEPDPPMLPVPFLLRPQGRQMGLFATRTPRRVNPIGLSLVRLLEVSRRTVEFAGVDLVHGTPVIDLKPYVAQFDRPPGDPRSGWFDSVPLTEGVTPADL
jgi:tRNA-Thr(GGU) m(6)t(6)A37 methyltransferase TsaA